MYAQAFEIGIKRLDLISRATKKALLVRQFVIGCWS